MRSDCGVLTSLPGTLYQCRATHLNKSLDVLCLCVILALSLILLPSIPLCLSSKVEHTWSRSVDVTNGGLLVETVEGELVRLSWLDWAVLWEALNDGNGLVELSRHVWSSSRVRD